MATVGALFDRDWRRADVLAGVLLVAGLGLVGVGGYYHFKIAAMMRTTHCDGCAPWHPLIIAPIVVGAAFLLVAGVVRYRRRTESTP